jgi:hypothetical protein
MDQDIRRPNTLAAFAIPVMLAMLGLLVSPVSSAAQPPETQAEGQRSAITLNEKERAFSERMAGAILTGRFTVDGDDSPPKAERYEIVAATKAGEHDWVVVARIQYGPNDVRVPVPVKMYWADDTPVLSLTDLTIPGLGTFTSRVMFFEDRYAGTWQHGKKGGHLFGTIGKKDDAGNE